MGQLVRFEHIQSVLRARKHVLDEYAMAQPGSLGVAAPAFSSQRNYPLIPNSPGIIWIDFVFPGARSRRFETRDRLCLVAVRSAVLPAVFLVLVHRQPLL